MYGILFTLPDASTTLNGIGAYSAPIFSDFLPLIELVVGIGLAVAIIAWLITHFLITK